MSTLDQRIIDAAKSYYDFGHDIKVDEEWLDSERDNELGGYWIQARLLVHDIDIEKNPGPAYTVWICFDHSGNWTDFSDWERDETYVFDDDPDGKRARRDAFERARYLRRGQEHHMFSAVVLSTREPLPLRPFRLQSQ